MWEKFTVLDRINSSAADRITTLVRQILAKRSIDRLVGRDEDLTESGLSSLDMVNLMLAVEGEFDLKIPDHDMTPSNFRSIARIEALVSAIMRNA
jgi:acyl carrier protein